MEYAFFVVFVIYLTPWIVSEARGHDHRGVILALNLTTGWTGVGWLGALVWASAGALPARAVRPVLAPVPPPPTAEEQRQSRRARGLSVAVVVALGLVAAAVAWIELPGLGAGSGTGVVAVEELVLRAAPGAERAALGTLPRGCVVALLEARGDWQRVWRTTECPAGAYGRSSGWVARRDVRPGG